MKYIKLLILTFLPFLVNAQNTYEHFAAYGTTSGISLVSADTFNFTITGFAGNARPYGVSSFARADVLVGDKIFLNCNQYVIRTITSTAPNLVGTLYKIDNTTNNPTNAQTVAIIREYTNSQGLISYALPPAADGNGGVLSGINISLASCIQAHYSKKDSLTLSNAFNNATDVYVYIGSSGVLPSVSPPTITQHLARNTVKELYQYNGSAWVLVGSGGGSSNIDNPIIDTITNASHGFTVGTALKANAITKADTNYLSTGGANFARWVVVKVIDANTYIVVSSGKFTSPSHGFNTDSIYYLSNTTAGLPVKTTGLKYSQVLFTVIDANNLFVEVSRPVINSISLVSSNIVVSGSSALSLNYNSDYVFTGTTTTWTLPAVSLGTTGKANEIRIKNRGTGAITLNTASGATIFDTSLVSTIIINSGEAVTILPDGTYFNIL